MDRLHESRFAVAGAATLLVIAAAFSAVATAAGAPTPIERTEQALAAREAALLIVTGEDDNNKAPIDYGDAPALRAARERGAPAAPLSTDAGFVPAGVAGAGRTGAFGPAVTWPVIPIHVVLLPDGRVMSYGTGASGAQGARLIYDVWDPALGTGTDAHLVLLNTTNTDIFCSAQSVMLNGEVLTSGGDITVNAVRNSANNSTTIFSPATNSIAENTPMSYARWYGALVSLPNGKLAISAGAERRPADPGAAGVDTRDLRSFPEGLGGADRRDQRRRIRHPGLVLPALVRHTGRDVFVLAHTGAMFYVDTTGAGSIRHSPVVAPAGNYTLPTIRRPGKVLSVRMNQQVVVVDYRTSTPVVTATASIDQVRYWASGSVMADGRVLVTGGSTAINKLQGIAYQAPDLGSVDRPVDEGRQRDAGASVPFGLAAAARCDRADGRRRRTGTGEEPERRDLLPVVSLRRVRAPRAAAGHCGRIGGGGQSGRHAERHGRCRRHYLPPDVRAHRLGHARL